VDLRNAELEATTGFPIAQGQLSIGDADEMAAQGIGRHDRLLFCTDVSLPGLPTNLCIWPIKEIARDEHGFCRPTLCEAGLALHAVTLEDIDRLAASADGRRRHTRSGAGAGYVMRRQPRETRDTAVEGYELAATHDSAGLRIAVSGTLAGNAHRPGSMFSVGATVPWETLHLKESPFAGASRVQGLPGWPYLRGQISLTPDVTWVPLGLSAHRFVSVHFDYPDAIRFNDAPRLEILDNGFARSSGIIRVLEIGVFGRPKLEQELRLRDSLTLQLTGDALGYVRYETGYADEFGDLLGWIHQEIKTMALSMTLAKPGLEITATGELNGFDPAEFARHREERDSQLKPLETYSLRATLPWALLAARGFRFADRADKF
jgi:hypothetical protein